MHTAIDLTSDPTQGAIELDNRERSSAGRPPGLAIKAMFDLPSAGVISSQIQDGVISTRAEVQITASADVEPGK